MTWNNRIAEEKDVLGLLKVSQTYHFYYKSQPHLTWNSPETKVAKTPKKFTTHKANAPHTKWHNIILTATGTGAPQHWYGYPSLTASQSHNECDYALLIWKNFSKAKIPTATNHISHLLS